jgi:hypothetical protein
VSPIRIPTHTSKDLTCKAGYWGGRRRS